MFLDLITTNHIFIAIIIFLIFIIFLFIRSTDYYRTEMRSYQCGCARMSSFIQEIGKAEAYNEHTKENIEKYTAMVENWNG